MRQRIATCSSGTSTCRIASTIAAVSAAGDGKARHDRLRPGRARRTQHLLGAGQPGDEAVREREHLRRRAVVLLESHDRRVGEARRDAEQVLGPGAGEGVDRLVVVADDAEVVAVAEPVLEQRLLQEIDVLILVDGERAVLSAEGRGRASVALEQAHRPLEQVLEVEEAVGLLASLVVDVDLRHQVDRDGRLPVGGGGEVGVGADASVLRPLDLGGKVACRPELEGSAQPVADLAEQQRLRRHDATELVRGEVAQLAQGGGVERAARERASRRARRAARGARPPPCR